MTTFNPDSYKTINGNLIRCVSPEPGRESFSEMTLEVESFSNENRQSFNKMVKDFVKNKFISAKFGEVLLAAAS